MTAATVVSTCSLKVMSLTSRLFLAMRICRALTPGPQAEDLLFDQVLFGVRQLEAVMAEHFQAVVPIRIVGGRNHHAGHERASAREVGDPRGSNDSGVAHAHALAGQPSSDHFGDPRTALA